MRKIGRAGEPLNVARMASSMRVGSRRARPRSGIAKMAIQTMRFVTSRHWLVIDSVRDELGD
jgi:hypothetical protein